MAQGLPRTRFDCSSLVRVLTELGDADVPASKQSFAERLGQWVGIGDALSLFSALDGREAGAAEVGTATSATDIGALRHRFTQLRASHVSSITAAARAEAGKPRIELPEPDVTAGGAADFAPYHRYYLAHQREMAASIAPMRAAARAALSRRSPGHARLAALDAVLDNVLSVRERNLLATVPTLLARRFAQLHEAHRAALGEAPTADDPARWMHPGAWLAMFCADLRAVLLAELELRLQPVAGLLAALDNEVTRKQ